MPKNLPIVICRFACVSFSLLAVARLFPALQAAIRFETRYTNFGKLSLKSDASLSLIYNFQSTVLALKLHEDDIVHLSPLPLK